MAEKKSKAKKGKTKKPSRKSHRSARSGERRYSAKHALNDANKSRTILSALAPSSPVPPPDSLPDQRVFSIEIGTISGDTTIGDLIVAFPRTRDVLMKHGLRFDVEEAGYLYMTLNVFSAIHGLAANTLVQELHTASKEPPLQSNPQQLHPIIVAPTT
jgi:hypothetical protein